MRKRIKRLIKGLLKTGALFVLVGVGVIIGLIIGVNTADRGETIVIRGDGIGHLAPMIEQRVEQQVVRQVEERIHEQLQFSPIPTIPPIPTVPPIPAIPTIQPIPTIPPIPDTVPRTVYIDHSPSFFDVVNGIGTVLASLGLIGLGIVLIIRGRRAPKEKTPESLNK